MKKSFENANNPMKNNPILSIVVHQTMIPTTCPQSSNRIEAHKQKHLHGKCIAANYSITTRTRKELESFVFAAQEQAIPKATYKANTLKTVIDPLSKLSGLVPESTQHIVSTCPTLAKQQCSEKHNTVGKIIYRDYYHKFGINTHQREVCFPMISENNNAKILWDMPIKT